MSTDCMDIQLHKRTGNPKSLYKIQSVHGILAFRVSKDLGMFLCQLHPSLRVIFVLHIELHSKHVYTVVNANPDGTCSTEWVVFTDTVN